MTIFQNALARIKEDDNPRLHRVPFTLIWMASYALAWFSISFVSTLHADLNRQLRRTDTYNQIYEAQWLDNLRYSLLGLLFGIILVLIQTWLIRRRYGFVPKFWRATTIIGAIIAGSMIAGSVMPFFNYYGMFMSEEVREGIFVWFTAISILQSVILFRVNRQAWLLALVGIIAGAVAFGIVSTNFYDAEIWGILLGTVIQAIGSAVIILRLMSNPREGIVPKRDSNEKAKTGLREGLHPMTFIGFWSMTYFVGWVILFALSFMLDETVGNTTIGRDIDYWLSNNAQWLFWMRFGGAIGLTSAIAQPWLMKQHSKVEIPHWFIFTLIGWALAGMGFFNHADGYSTSEVEKFTNLLIWFATPTLFQTIPMWRAMRGGWIWALTWLASAIIAYLIVNDGFYAIMLRGLAQAIITGSAFILLQSQQRRVERDAVSA
ncbi:MAG: hypothetical protein Phog2KO_25250 [Phototrophicaceae bacterium]